MWLIKHVQYICFFNLCFIVKALAKFIAWQLTCTNFNSTKWVKLGGYLTGCDTHLYHHICKTIDKISTTAPQREGCEHYILYWANHHASTESDKVIKTWLFMLVRLYLYTSVLKWQDCVDKSLILYLKKKEILQMYYMY